ncbi:MAG: phenylacetic acid degradation protein PaaN [Frankiales bacterium]|nr:phenylacetic acid degradation protein PaaN [Frankiales bacterium]
MPATTGEASATSLFARHRDLLGRAVEACRTRRNWTAYPDDPAAHPAGEEGRAAAEQWFGGQLGRPFDLDQPGPVVVQDDEVSPYTGEPLGISYPRSDVDALVAAALAAWPAWRRASHEERVGVCLEACDRLYRHNLELAYAAMHTTGQSFPMSYAGSGTNAIDRGIEAVAQAHLAHERVAPSATWSRDFGSTTVRLDKRYRLVPLGLAVVIACASFPAWNAYPAVLANLVTGNPVVLKPHPSSVLQMALAVRILRETLADAGFDPALVSLSVDSAAEPVAKRLVQHEATRIVDFTGSAAFGSWIEQNARSARVYTETSGANFVVLESVDDLAPVLRAVAGSLCLFTAQMCTSPQNVYVPRDGLPTSDGVVPAEEVAARLAEAVRAISGTPRRAAAVMGAVQAQSTLELLARVRDEVAARGTVLLEPAAYEHPEHPAARTSGPLLGLVGLAEHDLFAQEQFGPVGFVVVADDAVQAIERATRDAREVGAITGFVYSTDEQFVELAEELSADAGVALSVNLTGPMPLNFSAAYSDYHVTGLNPAGTATLSDESFIAGRFRVVQSRRPHVGAGEEDA